MHTYPVTIPKNGTIVIPKEVRKILSAENIIIKVDDNNNITIEPVKDLKGRFSSYKKSIDNGVDDSNLAWEIHVKEKFGHSND
jgi:bifunctional DNA-binding transcriptional regulator/antitoxin component of YhaV-PrlF toxin-antitoxin module